MIRSSHRVAVCLAIAAVIVASVPVLLAHAKLERTVPAANATLNAPPASVQLFFSQVPDAAVSRMSIKGPSPKVQLVKTHVMGKSLMATVDGEMTDGLYTVSWQTSADDGHGQKGEFGFTLKLKRK